MDVKSHSHLLVTGLGVLLALGLFGGGYLLGSHHATRTACAQAGTPGDLEELFKPFWETWNIIHEDYVNQPLDDRVLVEGAIEGMLDTLGDPYTNYLTPEELAMWNENTSGEFEGIGAEVSQDEDGALIIVSPMAGSPAEEAGLQSGDRVLAVDGRDIRDLNLDSIIALVRGPAGTSITLTVERAGVPDTFDVTIVRAAIVTPMVEWEMLPDNVAYVRLSQFGEDADADLHDALELALAPNPRGLVFDLRGNGGGLLNVALNITSEFVAEGTIMRERWASGHESSYKASGDGIATGIPMVVLVDRGSASASELLAGAIQDHERAPIVGETSFGKGTVQSIYSLSNGGALSVTVARWLTPDGHWIHGAGITPDVMVTWPVRLRQQPDPQVVAAVRVLDGHSVWPTWPLPWLDRVSTVLN
jgi:carboxyl-terminal processing protease